MGDVNWFVVVRGKNYQFFGPYSSHDQAQEQMDELMLPELLEQGDRMFPRYPWSWYDIVPSYARNVEEFKREYQQES